MTKCKGCGVTLQTEDPKKIGYTPKANSEYCQRCFRLMHYDDLQISMKTGIDPDEILKKISEMDCLVLWVVDLFDFEASMIEGINRHLVDKDIVMVATKRDILPESLGNEKIAKFIFARLKELGIKINGLVVTSKNSKQGKEEVLKAVGLLSKDRDIVVMGKANAGKSSLLNNLIGDNVLTATRYPGTTIDFNEVTIDGYHFIDTPGLEGKNSILMMVDEKDLKTVLPYKHIKPTIYQINGNQSFAIGGLVRIDLFECDKATAVTYLSDALSIHRSKVEHADELWEKHYGTLFTPITTNKPTQHTEIPKKSDKIDIVIDGLGWVCVSGQISKIGVYYPKGANVTFRKALL